MDPEALRGLTHEILDRQHRMTLAEPVPMLGAKSAIPNTRCPTSVVHCGK